MSEDPIRILMVEDNPGDVVLTREALHQAHVPSMLQVVSDGLEALDHLRQAQANNRLPQLIILDLNLPRKNGRELLADLNASPPLDSIPLVVLTSSRVDSDVLEGCTARRSLYLVKPHSYDDMVEIARTIRDFYDATLTVQ